MKKTVVKLTVSQQAFLEDLEDSIGEAGRIHRGEQAPSRRSILADPDVKRIRTLLGKSQPAFAAMIGVSTGTLRGWEQKRRRPTGPAMALLRVAEVNPQAVQAALRQPEDA